MPHALPALAAIAASALAFIACDANVTESCVAGPCLMGPSGAGGSSTTTSGSGGAATTSGSGGAATTSGSGGAGAAAACPTTPQTGDFPCEVFKVVHTHCNPCHQTPVLGGAPFPLLTYEDTQNVYQPGILVFQQMFEQIAPGAMPRMPLGDTLTPGEYATLRDWLAQCAPPRPEGMGCECPGNGCN